MRLRLEAIFENVKRNVFSEKQAFTLERALLALAADGAVRSELPDIGWYADVYLSAREAGDTLEHECALIDLYTRLHGAGSRYSRVEQEILEKRQGITCHPGGMLPLIMAETLLGPDSVVADLGAGNGLQGLLLQRMRPHRKTMQIELSAEMIRVGRMFQNALGIGEDRVEWVHGDIANAPLDAVDLVYLYRPAKPHEGGNELYREIARRLNAIEKTMVVISVADCISKYLSKNFSVLYSNEHLACLIKSCN
jgi:SAM-dependent methyltransferase